MCSSDLATFGYGLCSSIIFVKDDHLNVSVILSLVLSAESLPTVIEIGKDVPCLKVIIKSLEYAPLDLPLTLKADVGTVSKFKNPPGPVPEISFLSKRVVLPLFSVININTSTVVPKFLPSFSLY